MGRHFRRFEHFFPLLWRIVKRSSLSKIGSAFWQVQNKGFCLVAEPLRFMVGATGFEPATPITPRWCATELRYAPTGWFFWWEGKFTHFANGRQAFIGQN